MNVLVPFIWESRVLVNTQSIDVFFESHTKTLSGCTTARRVTAIHPLCARRLRPGQALLVKTQSGRELERIEAKASRLRSEVERLFGLAAAAAAKRDPLLGASLGVDANCLRGGGGGNYSGRRPATTAGVSGAGRGKRRACGQVRALLSFCLYPFHMSASIKICLFLRWPPIKSNAYRVQICGHVSGIY